MSEPKRTEPSWSLMTPRNPKEPSGYVRHEFSDIRIRFDQVRAQMRPPASTKNVATLKRKDAK